MTLPINIPKARPEDAPAVADIHLTARREAMPYLNLAHTDDETRDYFARTVGTGPTQCWVARHDGQVAGYMPIAGEDLDHLYVRSGWQRRGIGLALLTYARTLSPQRLTRWTFQRNAPARAFYEAQVFRAVESTDGCNEENEPDVRYLWEAAG